MTQRASPAELLATAPVAKFGFGQPSAVPSSRDFGASKVASGKAWQPSSCGSVEAEQSSEKDKAVALLLVVCSFLESRGFTIKAKALASNEEEFKELIRPRRAGTTIRNCNMFKRFIDFLNSSAYYAGHFKVRLEQQALYAWVSDLARHRVGKYTPRLAIGCVRHLQDILEFECEPISKLIYNFVKKYEEDRGKVPHEPEPLTEKFMEWLEWVIRSDSQFTTPDRLLCCRVRALIQSSTRHNDQKRTPVYTLQRIFHEDGSSRGIMAQTKATKTFERSWSCSVLGVTAAGDGWTETFIDLLWLAHGAGIASDDHVGKRATGDREFFDVGPPNPQADTYHLRFLMLKSNQIESSPVKFLDEDVEHFTHHKCKNTLTSLAQHLGMPRKSIRFQGGWRGKLEDLMPDTYLRAKQTLAIRLQEECIEFIRGGGKIPRMNSSSILDSITIPLRTSTEPSSKHVQIQSQELEVFGTDCLSPKDRGSPSDSPPEDPNKTDLVTTLWEAESSQAIVQQAPEFDSFTLDSGVSSDVSPKLAISLEEAGQKDDSESSQSDSSDSGDTSGQEFAGIAESEAMEELVERPLTHLICNPVSGCYHRMDDSNSDRPACHVPGKLFLSIPAFLFERWRSSRFSFACTRCFTSSGMEENPCKHFCGRVLPGGLCPSQCREHHLLPHLSDHDCFQHDEAEVRAAKRARGLDTEISSLNDEIQHASNSIA